MGGYLQSVSTPFGVANQLVTHLQNIMSQSYENWVQGKSFTLSGGRNREKVVKGTEKMRDFLIDHSKIMFVTRIYSYNTT